MPVIQHRPVSGLLSGRRKAVVLILALLALAAGWKAL